MSEFICWRCGASIDAGELRYRRLQQCECGAELHVCRMCRHFAPRLPGGCSEDRAEEVMDKERANFCDYFTPAPGAYKAPDDASKQRARSALDHLFETGTPGASDADDVADAHRQRLNDLFDD